jgi:hypothetical protein
MEWRAIPDLNKVWLVLIFVVIGAKALREINVLFWRPWSALRLSAAHEEKLRIVEWTDRVLW